MRERVLVRQMRAADADGIYRMSSEAITATAEEREQVRNRRPEEVEWRKARYRHFLVNDPEGAWVAADGEKIVGVSIAVVREGVWVLSLYAVAEEYRNAGLGRELLESALAYATPCRGGMIASSSHPAAMRRYSLAGFALRPTLTASGVVRRASLPAGLESRVGTREDLMLADKVDRLVRGAAHGPDLEFMLRSGSRLLVAEGTTGRGYAVVRDRSPALLAATTPETAKDLLWSCLAQSGGSHAEVSWITEAQQWAIPTVLEAGLSLSPAGPICVRGTLGPLTPY
ncbi:MAG TPA: GNAT family N-acetyltransferase, partial [Rubrobacter sp.]|nr:GNAT family N-acetyltransferase [Rubrobacter sp.]